MEIFENNTWNELCTPNWNEDENILTCMAMGYFKNSLYDNARYNYNNTSNATIRHNCSSLTNCMKANKKKPQLCKGICPVKIVFFISFVLSFLWKNWYVRQARGHKRSSLCQPKPCLLYLSHNFTNL